MKVEADVRWWEFVEGVRSGLTTGNGLTLTVRHGFRHRNWLLSSYEFSASRIRVAACRSFRRFVVESLFPNRLSVVSDRERR